MTGFNQGIKLLRGFILYSNRKEYMVDGKPLPVIPTYHPSFLLRSSKTRSKDKGSGAQGKVEKAEGGMALSGVVRRDIELAIQIAKYGPPERRKFETIKGTREVMEQLIREAKNRLHLPLAWDIETPRSLDKADDESEIDSIQAHVTQIQFALDTERGFVFPGFEAEWVKNGARELLALNNRKYSWNGWKFDNKVVTGHHGIPVLGEDIDLMSAWHWVQPDLPMGLQFATSFHAPDLGPWKHLAFDDEDLYGACDVISLHMNAEGIFQTMANRGLRTSYDRHVLMLRPEMVAASRSGFPIDPTRHEEFGHDVNVECVEIESVVQPMIPEEILNLEPKKKAKGSNTVEYGYVNIPKQIKPFLDEEGNTIDGSDRIIIHEAIPVEDEDGNDTEEMIEKSVIYVKRLVKCFDKKTLELVDLERWCRMRPFSTGSSQQIIKYVLFRREEEIQKRLAKKQSRADAERLAKYKVPKVKNKQREMKDNTGAKELEKLAKETGDPVFTNIVEIKKLKKMYGTYYKGWRVQNGYVHTTFGLSDTGTGQFSSVEPNIQNAPKHSKLSKKFRACIRAKEGKILLEFDKKSFHAQTLAFEAKEKTYARLSAIDIHSFVTAHRLRLPQAHQLLGWSDKDMLGWFNEMKADHSTIYPQEACVAFPHGMTFEEVRDFKSKKVILGIGFCQGAGSIYEQNPESYVNKKEVQVFLDLLKELIPNVFIWHKKITQEAHEKTYLISRWGYIRRFHDVFQWDSKRWNTFSGSLGDWANGDDYEAAVAFLPANDAFGMIKEEMLRLAGYRVEKSLIQDMAAHQGKIPYKRNDTPSPNWKLYLEQKMIWAVRESENLLAKYGFVNQLHDSLMFHCDLKLEDKCCEDVTRIMSEPCLTLSDPEMAPNGLIVYPGAKHGDDWNSMKNMIC